MALILVGASIYLIASLVGDVENVIKLPEPDAFYEYSGIQPELYKQYLSTKDLDYIEELALYADLDVRDEIHEKILKQKSLIL